ncbi:MAG: energy-coupling factor transporter transmembrane component T, partial [Spirochaetales bacterium]|nr:energy-coupling factor transporter transmembrane component T [Spirochaetales bacterium]
GNVLLKAGTWLCITNDGLSLAGLLILRFCSITSVFYLFFSTTETVNFILALRSFGLPYKAALTITISLRYIPDMFVTYNRITEAHKLRSAGINSTAKKSFKNRFGKFFPVLISVLIHAVKNIPSLAMALDSKGFGRENSRTSCKSLVSWGQIVFQLILTFILSAIFITAVILF